MSSEEDKIKHYNRRKRKVIYDNARNFLAKELRQNRLFRPKVVETKNTRNKISMNDIRNGKYTDDTE